MGDSLASGDSFAGQGATLALTEPCIGGGEKTCGSQMEKTCGSQMSVLAAARSLLASAKPALGGGSSRGAKSSVITMLG
jgi:hypothetical protein